MLRSLLLSTALMLGLHPAGATVFKDEQLQRLLDQGRGEELQREARKQGGADGAAALVLALLREGGDLAPAIRAGEDCVAQYPQSAACHYALGSALGVEAQRGGVLKGMRLVGRVKEAFGQAVQLDPQMFEARTALHLIYLALPSMAGGSVDKARQLELAVRDSQPELAKLLRARQAAQAKRWDEAERELGTVQLGAERSFQLEIVNAWAGLARQWNKEGQHAKSRQRFEQLSRQLPELALPVFQLARNVADQGQYAEAIRLFDRARGLQGASGLPIDHRVGIAWMDLGDKDKARQFLQRFVQDRRADPRHLEDARRRLRELA
jgi:tetratricopeptide (TPR) repeat protein